MEQVVGKRYIKVAETRKPRGQAICEGGSSRWGSGPQGEQSGGGARRCFHGNSNSRDGGGWVNIEDGSRSRANADSVNTNS